jgi:hypothetical protein
LRGPARKLAVETDRSGDPLAEFVRRAPGAFARMVPSPGGVPGWVLSRQRLPRRRGVLHG